VTEPISALMVTTEANCERRDERRDERSDDRRDDRRDPYTYPLNQFHEEVITSQY